jgi:hypothetical protein
MILCIILQFYILIAIYSVVFAVKKLNRPGVSTKVRILFIKKHFAYVFVFTIIWYITLSQNYFFIFNPNYCPEDNSETSFIESPVPQNFIRGEETVMTPSLGLAVSIMTFSTGIFLTIARFFEPLFRYIIVQQIYQFWGEIYIPKD